MSASEDVINIDKVSLSAGKSASDVQDDSDQEDTSISSVHVSPFKFYDNLVFYIWILFIDVNVYACI